jgi:peptidoglycan-associated lipoprotein
MFARNLSIAVAALLVAAGAGAQERGTVEFGGFASNTSFGNSLGLDNAWGYGGRVGAFLHPRVSLEFEAGAASAGRSLGLNSVNVGVLSGRVTTVPLESGRLHILLGAGVDHTDTYYLESYGFHGLLGAKVDLWNTGSLRVDGIESHMSKGSANNAAIHLGLSFYRNPFGRMNTVTRMVSGPTIMGPQRPDSVSAYETQRLRQTAAVYAALRDSLNRTPSSSAALATMREMIYFKNDASDLSDSARTILDDKVTVFRANPAMRIVISGYASEPGTTAYNMALGLRRAEAAKAYLVSRGVDPIRIEIATKGEGTLQVDGPGALADAANRNGQFRLLIADPYLAAPRKP